MINFAQKALEYSDSLNQIGFVASGVDCDATLRNLRLVGEAAIRILKEAQTNVADPDSRIMKHSNGAVE